VPLADLQDLVFAAWDPIPDDAYTAAVKPGYWAARAPGADQGFPPGHQAAPRCVRPVLREAAAGHQREARQDKRELAEQLREDIRSFRKSAG